ncbi:ARM repeat protein interacting with ABF2 [Balamuthia mandrillaris]
MKRRVAAVDNLPQLTKDLGKLVNNKELSDVVFLVGKRRKRLYAVASLLRVRSEVLQNMFMDPFREGRKDQPIIVPNIEPPVFLEILRFLHTGEFELENIVHTVEVFRAADQYLLEDMKKLCLRELYQMLAEDNVLHTLQFAHERGLDEVVDECCKFIDNHARGLLFCKQWEEDPLPTSLVVRLVKRQTLLLDEADLFLAVVRWYTAAQAHSFHLNEDASSGGEEGSDDDDIYPTHHFTGPAPDQHGQQLQEPLHLEEAARKEPFRTDAGTADSPTSTGRDTHFIIQATPTTTTTTTAEVVGTQQLQEVLRYVEFHLIHPQVLFEQVEKLHLVDDHVLKDAYRSHLLPKCAARENMLPAIHKKGYKTMTFRFPDFLTQLQTGATRLCSYRRNALGFHIAAAADEKDYLALYLRTSFEDRRTVTSTGDERYSSHQLGKKDREHPASSSSQPRRWKIPLRGVQLSVLNYQRWCPEVTRRFLNDAEMLDPLCRGRGWPRFMDRAQLEFPAPPAATTTSRHTDPNDASPSSSSASASTSPPSVGGAGGGVLDEEGALYVALTWPEHLDILFE